jgi:phenylalanyl-tRNA synthetase beta chain
MRIGYNWLREFVEIDLDPASLAESLTMLGFLAKTVGPRESEFAGVVVGEVLDVKKHPRADRLVLCHVCVGESTLSIVCGATNVIKGMKVPVACAGSVLPGGQKIDRTVIRGQASEGMLCSGAELGLGGDASGILRLADDSVAGRLLEEELGVAETVIDVEVSHNRPDCLSVYGLAREISALTGAALRRPEVDTESPAHPTDEIREIVMEDTSDCPRYCGLVLSGIEVKTPPLWLRARLEIAGFRSLNSVVDCTNYCLATFGQPIHAFDLDRMKQKAILVRRARAGESIVTLDGRKRLLNPDVLLITDGEEPIAVAGVMGGEATEVEESTKQVLLESAYFSPRVVKLSSRRLGLESEASHRFTRGIDHESVRWCIEYVGSLMSSLSDGVVRGKVLEQYPDPVPEKRVKIRPARIASLLGCGVSREFMKERMEKLGFTWHEGQDSVEVGVPSFRYDVREEVDVCEEIARSFGYDRFAERGANLSSVPGADDEEEVFLRRCREALVALGLTEAVTRTLVNPQKASLFTQSTEELAELGNPASVEEAVLRPSVLSGLLEAVGLNVRRGCSDVRLFEVGKGFRAVPTGAPVETWRLACAITGSKKPASWQDRAPGHCDFFDVKGVVEGLLGKLAIDNVDLLCYDGAALERETSGSICCNGKVLGLLGKVSREVLRAFDIQRDVYVFELDARQLRVLVGDGRAFVEPPRFPPVKRDLAAVVDETLPEVRVAKLIEESGGSILTRVEFFDLYRGEAIADGKKSLAYSLTFQSKERTLSDKEVDDVVGRIVESLASKGITIRGRFSKAD